MAPSAVSVLFNEPKLLKYEDVLALLNSDEVSVLFNEPKLLKSVFQAPSMTAILRFSALQRAEIAEMLAKKLHITTDEGFSALQRAEIAEIC